MRVESAGPDWLRRFGPIWTGQTLSQVGSSLATFALIWWLTTETGSSRVLATATLATFIPMIVLRPFTGALVDRWSRRWTIVISDGAIALVSLWLAWLFWRGEMQLIHVYIVAAARAVGQAFHTPAMVASTALLVPEKHLGRFAGLNHAVDGGLRLVGPALGAVAITFLPLHSVMLIDVATATLAILPVLLLGIPQPARTERVRRDNIWLNVRKALRYMRSAPGLFVIVGWFTLSNGLGALTYPFLPLYVKDFFRGGALHLAGLESVNGIGFIVGGLLFALWPGFKSKTTTIFVAASLSSVGGLLLGFAPTHLFLVAGAGMLLMGLMNPFMNSPLAPLVQSNIPNELQGRIMSLIASLAFVLQPIGVLSGAFIVERFGIRPILQITSGLFLFSGLLALLPIVRGLEKRLRSLREAHEKAA